MMATYKNEREEEGRAPEVVSLEDFRANRQQWVRRSFEVPVCVVNEHGERVFGMELVRESSDSSPAAAE